MSSSGTGRGGPMAEGGAMFDVAWGVGATAFGWIIATDFRHAAQRFHALSHAVVPFGGGGAPVVGVGFLRFVAGVFALVGPVILVTGVMDVWRGEAEADGLPPIPAWFAVAETVAVAAFLWWMWRRSGVLRREWGLPAASCDVPPLRVSAHRLSPSPSASASVGVGGYSSVGWPVACAA
ncbi:hypothetical protein ACWIG2_14820 [Streptomyces cellulosae]